MRPAQSALVAVPAWLLLLAVLAAPAGAADPGDAGTGPEFDALFTGETLRIDVYHTGSRAEEEFTLDGLRVEGSWAGSRLNLLDDTNLGAYLFRMSEAATGRPIFSRGFSSLFGEWRTTGEAATTRRTMHETVLAPMPREPAYITIAARGPSNIFTDLFSAEIDPDSRSILRESPCVAGELIDISVTGAASRRLDLLIVGEGYRTDQAEKFRRDASRFARLLLDFPPFSENRDRINVRALRTPSKQSGTDEPRKRVFRKTAVGTTFNTFDTERYLTAPDNRLLRDLAACAPYDSLLIVVNSARYGGAGIHDQWAVVTSDNEYSDYVAIHELGHALAGLGDEYFTSEVAYNEFYRPGVEPWEPNITALVPDGRPKWASLIADGVPVPTPPEEDRYGGVVGVFEGAGYAARGLYRPALDCMMFSKGYSPFDPVCSRAIERIIARQADVSVP
jgi:hypothetical protein